MTAAPRQALLAPLALAFLAGGANAFVPGSVAHGPHVRLPPAISGFAGGAGAKAAAPRAGSRTSVMTMPLDSSGLEEWFGSQGDWNFREELARREPLHFPINANDLVAEWTDDPAGKGIQDFRSVCYAMQEVFSSDPPDYVVALTFENRTDEVQAIAAISYRTSWSASVMDISALVVKPTVDQQEGAAAELIRKIRDWAAKSRNVVFISNLLEFDMYYRNLGIPSNDYAWPSTYLLPFEAPATLRERASIITIEAGGSEESWTFVAPSSPVEGGPDDPGAAPSPPPEKDSGDA